MHILMMTNTFTPLVGGVTRSVESFTRAYRKRGHRVTIVAPEFPNMPRDETGVIRVPAIQQFNGSDFSVVLSMPGAQAAAVDRLRPDIVHAHHPFLIGATALRVAHHHARPLVFTHHTMYERYTHYVPGDCETLKRFVVELSTNYANLCDQVVAPSESVRDVLAGRGVRTPIAVIPTGIDVEAIAGGDGPGFRAALGIAADALVVGHVGRLAEEKNIDFLIDAVLRFLAGDARRCFLVVGRGPVEPRIRAAFAAAGLAGRLHLAGVLEGPLLASAYRAMNLFAFASTSETQGLVLAEAMAAGVPVVALDAPGVREVVRDDVNGRLLVAADAEAFAVALAGLAGSTAGRWRSLRAAARRTAADFAQARVADRALVLYETVGRRDPGRRRRAVQAWSTTIAEIRAEWDLLRGMAEAAGAAMAGGETPAEPPLRH